MANEQRPEWRTMTSVEGLPLLGGEAQARIRLHGDHGVLLEIIYPAGVRSPQHRHQHDSYIYLLSGHLAGTIDGQPAELHAGQTLIHPKGVLHEVQAVTESHWIEFKSPPQIVWR